MLVAVTDVRSPFDALYVKGIRIRLSDGEGEGGDAALEPSRRVVDIAAVLTQCAVRSVSDGHIRQSAEGIERVWLRRFLVRYRIQRSDAEKSLLLIFHETFKQIGNRCHTVNLYCILIDKDSVNLRRISYAWNVIAFIQIPLFAFCKYRKKRFDNIPNNGSYRLYQNHTDNN